MQLTLNAKERLQLFQVLPDQMGSLEESLCAENIRNRVITDEFKNTVEWSEKFGNVSFDPNKLASIPTKTFTFSDNEAEVIAYGFLYDEQSGEVPTDSAYLNLYREFEPIVQELK